ncbi:MAG: ATP synthase F1 subunit delta [Mucilaginibacter sp.]
MSELTVASRYAKSLIDLSQEQNTLEEINNDMNFFLHTLKANPQLKAVLANPIISHTKKLHILEDIFSSRVNKLSISFFKLMVNKGRGEVLYTTAQEFNSQYNIIKHITKATVVSAAPLSEANKKTLLDEVKAAVGGVVILDAKTDPSLIGGFVLTVGDRQVDTSIAAGLKKLKKDFATGIVK